MLLLCGILFCFVRKGQESSSRWCHLMQEEQCGAEGKCLEGDNGKQRGWGVAQKEIGGCMRPAGRRLGTPAIGSYILKGTLIVLLLLGRQVVTAMPLLLLCYT